MRKTTIIALVVFLACGERGQDSTTLAETVEVAPMSDMNDTAKRLVRSLAYGSMTSELIRHERQRYHDLPAGQQQLAATALVEFVASLNGGSWDENKRLRASLILVALTEFKTSVGKSQLLQILANAGAPLSIRIAVIKYLGHVGNKSDIPLLKKLISNEERSLAHPAAIACRRIDSGRCLPAIKKRKNATNDPHLKEALELAIGSTLKEDDALSSH